MVNKDEALSLSLKWSVQAIMMTHSLTFDKHNGLSTTTKTVIIRKTVSSENRVDPTAREEKGSAGRLVIYTQRFLRLLSSPLPMRNRLVFELPLLNGFRAGEVSTFHAEWANVETGDITVLDSKKLMFFTLPMDPTLGAHIDSYRNETGIFHGELIRGQKRTGKGLTVGQIERLWYAYCGMPPRMGRAYWAHREHYILGKPTGHIQFMLRHDDIQSTEHYLSSLISYEDQKAIFMRGKKSPFSLSTTCSRFDACPLSEDGCRCRMFQPKLQEVATP